MSIRILVCLPLALLACRTAPQPISVEFRMAELQPFEGSSMMILSEEEEQDTFYLYPDTLLTEHDIAAAEALEGEGQHSISIRFSEEGADALATLTEEHIGSHLGIVIDGILVSAPLIRDRIEGGRAVITGRYTQAQAADIAHRLSRR